MLMASWPVQDAKLRCSEMLDAAAEKSLQVVRGLKTAEPPDISAPLDKAHEIELWVDGLAGSFRAGYGQRVL
jgi:hypothetical protein